MKVLIFGGFLGSGKTSLILQLAKYLVAHSDRTTGKTPLVIIENEIGDIGIDDKAISAGGYEVKGLFSGCICCTLVSDLTVCIKDVTEKLQPEWVIIEATGLAYPQNISETILKYTDFPVSVTIVADAQRWEDLNEVLEPLITGQVKNAANVLFNKIDLSSDEMIKTAIDGIMKINPNGRLFKVCATKDVDESVWEAIANG